MKADTILSVKHLRKLFTVGRPGLLRTPHAFVHAVDDVSFTLGKSEVLAVVGDRAPPHGPWDASSGAASPLNHVTPPLVGANLAKRMPHGKGSCRRPQTVAIHPNVLNATTRATTPTKSIDAVTVGVP